MRGSLVDAQAAMRERHGKAKRRERYKKPYGNRWNDCGKVNTDSEVSLIPSSIRNWGLKINARSTTPTN